MSGSTDGNFSYHLSEYNSYAVNHLIIASKGVLAHRLLSQKICTCLWEIGLNFSSIEGFKAWCWSKSLSKQLKLKRQIRPFLISRCSRLWDSYLWHTVYYLQSVMCLLRCVMKTWSKAKNRARKIINDFGGSWLFLINSSHTVNIWTWMDYEELLR